jgi:hypothetical protein
MLAKKKFQILSKILFYVSSVLIALTLNIVLLLMIIFAHVIF